MDEFSRSSDRASVPSGPAGSPVDELLAVIPDIVVTVTADGRLSECSAASTRLLGYAPDELIGRRFEELSVFDAEGVATALRELHLVLNGQRSGAIMIPMQHRDGSRRWFEVRSAVVRRADGTTVVRAILRDTTERLMVEQRLRAIIDHTNDIIMVMDADGTIRFENQAVELILGYTPGERIGRSILELVHPDDVSTVIERLGQLREPDQTASLIARFRHKNGSWRYVEASGRNMTHVPAIGGVLGVGRDITERMRLQERLESAERLDSIGRLAGGIAHDFNNLLAVVLASAEDLRQGSRSPSETGHGLSLIVDAAERARDLTSKLLTFARRQPMESDARVEASRSLMNAQALLGRLVGAGCALQFEVSGSRLMVPLAPPQFEQLLLNLAANARDAMPDGGTLRISLGPIDTRSLRDAGLSVGGATAARLAFRDSGVGMTPEVVAKAFEPFYSTKEHGKGTGLGLSVVYGIVRSCGGDVRITSDSGLGTLIELFLPLTEDRRNASAPIAPAAVRGGDETVLVVEDNDDVRNLTTRTLSQVGYRVLEASGGQQALALIADGQVIDLVVADVVMPQMNGVAMAQEIRRRKEQMPVLFITGYTPEHVLDRQPLDERTSLLTKPFKRDTFLQHVRAMLDVTTH